MIKRYHRAYFDKWYRGRGRITTEAEVRRKAALAVAEAEYFLRRSVLDVGCGEGGVSRWATNSSQPRDPMKL